MNTNDFEMAEYCLIDKFYSPIISLFLFSIALERFERHVQQLEDDCENGFSKEFSVSLRALLLNVFSGLFLSND